MEDPFFRDSPDRGFPLMVGGTLIALAILAVLAWPRGPLLTVERRITQLDVINGIAWVKDANGRVFRVHLPRKHNCGVGDRVQLSERRTLWGRGSNVALVPEPCSR